MNLGGVWQIFGADVQSLGSIVPFQAPSPSEQPPPAQQPLPDLPPVEGGFQGGTPGGHWCPRSQLTRHQLT